MDILKKNSCNIIVAILCIIQIAIGIHANLDRIISGDEIFSVGLANNTGDYLFFTQKEIDQYSNDAGWFDASLYHNYLTVQADEQFSYGNVLEKQKHDVHPPLYYYLVHTISSVTPDYANYLGIAIINIIAMCGVIILLYLSMKKTFKNSILCIVPCILWVCSQASYHLVTYIRMYAMLSFFTLCIIYLHICLIIEKEISKKRFLQMAMTVCLGGITHYYFYVLGFFAVLFYLLLQVYWYKKEILNRKKQLSLYMGSFILGGCSAFLIFPRVVYHVLKTNVGSQVQDNFVGGSIPIRENLEIVNSNVFQGHFYIVLLIVLSGLVLSFCLKRTNEYKYEYCKEYFGVCVYLALVGICYLFLVMKITIYVAWYYICPIYSVFLLLTAMLCCIGACNGQRFIAYICCGVLSICSIGFLYNKELPEIEANRKSGKEYISMVESLSGNDCIYLSESWNCLYGNHLPDMAVMDEVRCITPDNYCQMDLKELLSGRETTEQGLVMICRKIDEQEKYLEQMKEQTGLQAMLVWSDEKNAFYRF